jgi:hypothetical protein
MDPAADLATSAEGWDIAEKVVIRVDGDLYLSSPMADELAPVVYSPEVPGLHLIRAFARGRREHSDLVVSEASEEYRLVLSPTSVDSGHNAVGADGVS